MKVRHNDDRGGFALVAALGLLVMLMAWGFYYVDYMSIDFKESLQSEDDARIRVTTRAGVYAAIGEIQAALDNGTMGEYLAGEHTYNLPFYTGDGDPEHKTLKVDAKRGTHAVVTVLDECAKVNLNHVPPRVLQALLNVDPNTARAIRRGLPSASPGDGIPGQQHWIAGLDDLRKYMKKDALEAINADLLTVDSVLDQSEPRGFINLNSASPEVLSAVLGIGMEAAQKVVAARPLTSVADLVAAAGVEPAAFTIPPPADAPASLPQEFSFDSRCYRIVSTFGGAPTKTGSQIEAVVFFPERGRYVIGAWNEMGKQETS